MKARKAYPYDPDYAVAPGETLLEVMESSGMTQKEFAVRTGLTVQSLNRIFRGEQPISFDTAARLELVTGTPARLWNNLETNYRERLAALAERERLQAELAWLKQIPTAELIERGAIQAAKSKADILRNTLQFYGVSSVAAWTALWERPAVAARRSACFESLPGPASAWIRLGELQAYGQTCKPFSKSRFRDSLARCRRLTREPPAVSLPKLTALCASCGVALALVKEMKKVPWNGATKWLAPGKVMVLLNLRGKSEDKFWFSFFHEAGHVLHDSKKDLLINDGSQEDPRETRANQFAAETLIPVRDEARIRAARSAAEITAIADELGVSPGIVAGRYQFLTQQWGWFKDLIRRLEWAG
jgi:HTH-type transcriptional regulator / antitoxin HigA